MNPLLLDESLDPSRELLDVSLHRATIVWRQDIQRHFSHPTNGLPPWVWEAVAAERSKKESSKDQRSVQDIDIDSCVWRLAPFINARATTESYDRFFPLEPISGGTNILNYLKSFPLSTAKDINHFDLVLSEVERRYIIGPRSLNHGDLSKTLPGTTRTVVDHYSSKRISVDNMSTTKIRKDLDYMWRHRMYSDVQLVVPASTRHSKEDDEIEERMVSVFSCHRWVLLARSPYFRDLLWASGSKAEARKSLNSHPIPNPEAKSERTDGINIVPLPSPPFDPITLDFTLRFLYTGALQLSNQQFPSDRDTAFTVYRAALFLRIPSLKDLILAHMVSDLMHGFFSASLSDRDFSRATGGLWKSMTRPEGEGWEEGKGGCICHQCSRRAPRILYFSLEPDIKDTLLERGARRALVGQFGPGWCTQEFASLSYDLHTLILEDLQSMIAPRNALSLLFAAEEAFERLGLSPTFWDAPVRRVINAARKRIEKVLCQEPKPSFFCDDWKDIVKSPYRIRLPGRALRLSENDRINEENKKKKLNWIVDAVRRSMQPQNAAALYQTLTWFTDAQVPPEKQNKPLVETISALAGELYQQMMESRPPSILSSASSIFETIDPSHRAALDALDLSSTSDLASGSSVYSHPSSRTKSTDYGFFYTRMALSQETIETMTIRRRRSWDSVSVDSGL